jgi:hypothetical protein
MTNSAVFLPTAVFGISAAWYLRIFVDDATFESRILFIFGTAVLLDFADIFEPTLKIAAVFLILFGEIYIVVNALENNGDP